MPKSQPDVGVVSKRTVRLRLKDLELLELNARFMRHETFQTLVANVRRDGGLMGQTPFACKVGAGETHLDDGTVLDGRYLVLSGNHRTKAAIEAGVEFEEVTITDDDLPEQRRLAIQLSQNAIAGEDDPATLKLLYEKLDEVDWRVYSGLDDKQLQLLEEVTVGSLSEANLSFETVTIAFLPTEADEVREAWDAAREYVSSRPDEVWVARLLDHERVLDALELAGRSYGVTNVAVALAIVLGVFERHRDDLGDGFLTDWDEPKPGRENAWVPLAALFGGHEVPSAAAGTIRRALKAMRKQGDLPEGAPWQAIELWAAEYLAGVAAEAVEADA